MWWLLFATVSTSAITVNYGVSVTLDFGVPTTITSFGQTGAYLSNFTTGCSPVFQTFPLSTTEACFIYLGPATQSHSTTMAIVTFPITPGGTYTINVLNYLVASPSTIGPVFQGTTVAVPFTISSTYYPPYVALAELPTLGEFFIGDHTLNATDLDTPFPLTDGVAPFRFRPFSTTLNVNESISFYGVNGTGTVSTPLTPLTIEVHAGEAQGIVTFPNVTCNFLKGVLCLNVASFFDLYVNLTYDDASQWPKGRIITVQIAIAPQTIAASFSIPASIAARFLLHEDLDGNHNPLITYSGSLSFSTYVTLEAPLDMLQAALSPLTVEGENDGGSFNTGYASSMPPMVTSIMVATCIERLDTVLDSCSRDPALNQTFFLPALTYPSIVNPFSVPFTPILWFVIICALLMCCVPMIGIITDDIHYAIIMEKQLREECIPWCRTWPPCCIICCPWCPCPCAYSAFDRQQKIKGEVQYEAIRKEVERERSVECCGCCMLCGACGQTACYMKEDESSNCGRMCECCDYRAKKANPKFNQDGKYDKFLELKKKERRVPSFAELATGGATGGAASTAGESTKDDCCGDCCGGDRSGYARTWNQDEEPVDL